MNFSPKLGSFQKKTKARFVISGVKCIPRNTPVANITAFSKVGWSLQHCHVIAAQRHPGTGETVCDFPPVPAVRSVGSLYIHTAPAAHSTALVFTST